MIQLVQLALVISFPISEVILAFKRRSRGRAIHRDDGGSWRVLWVTVAVSVCLAALAQGLPFGRLPGSPGVLRLLGLAFLAGGLILRWAAILTLGQLFTVDVAVHPNHAVVQSGLYARVRHPSYTGLLLAFIGLGIYFGNWVSMLVLVIPIPLAIANRVVKEERTLLAALGPEYAKYCVRTKRFIPRLL